MTLQGDPQPRSAPSESPARSRRPAPGISFRALMAAGAMVAAVALTPPFPGAAKSMPADPSPALQAASFERLATPAVVHPSAEPAAPAVVSPVEAPAAQAPSTETPAAETPQAPAGWTIPIAGSGGQDLVDACIGPVHYTPTDAFSLFITEHDYCGGWERFSSIGVGQTVTLPGYGTYTVSARGQVPLGGTTSHVSAAFGGFPKAVLQTCIPGTSQMLVIALN